MFKTVIFTIMLLLLLVPIRAQATTAELAATAIVDAGERALKSGNVTEAVHEFSKALMIHPDNKKANWYLKRLHVEGLYTTTRTRTEQIGSMARDIRDYQENVAELQEQRYYLQERVDLLEDAIERKGDHQLLKDIEDYYREAAFYDIEPNLPYDQQLAALKRKHNEFKEYAYDRDRVQDTTIVVMDQLLRHKRQHLEDARDDYVHHRIELAGSRRELLAKADRLKKLQSEYDEYLHKSVRDDEKIRQLQRELAETERQIDLLSRRHEAQVNNQPE